MECAVFYGSETWKIEKKTERKMLLRPMVLLKERNLWSGFARDELG